MKVSELVKQLLSCDQNAEVEVHGSVKVGDVSEYVIESDLGVDPQEDLVIIDF